MIFDAMWIVGGFTSADWTAESNQVGAWFGFSLSSAGDVNGDGYPDVIVGAPYYANGQSDEGRAFVYLGSAAGLAAAPVWTTESNQVSALFGGLVAGGGDVNGDGFDDVLVTAWDYDNGETNEGKAWVYHGSAAGLDSNASWSAEGNQSESDYGLWGAIAGDVNGDGFDDVAVAAITYSNGESDEGRVFVYHGSATGLSLVEAWTAESNQADTWFGHRTASAGDVDGDGYGDVIIGAPYSNYVDGEGRAYAFLGSATGLAATAAWTTDSNQIDARYGLSVAGAGDVNADGYDDVLVGAPYFDNGSTDEGRAYLYLGSTTGLATTPSWTTESDQIGALHGEQVAGAGDLNADGYDDAVVGASYWDGGAADEGAAFVFLGAATGLELLPTFVLESGQGSSQFGYAVAPAGDVDGDGYDDMLVGAHEYDGGQSNEGRAYSYAGTCADTLDTDGDTVGDACDACPGFDDRLDGDLDGVADDCDLCPALYDPTQGDEDADGIGDACDDCPASSPDVDKDGFCAAQDCDDDNPAVYPDAQELCDGLDNACNGYVFPNELDEDGDGERICAGDCDDANPALNTSAAEVCNGLDDDCDGDLSSDELDADDDHVTVCGGDCDDFSARRSPELTDICGDGIDNDCDGEVDQTCGDDGTESTGCTCNAAGLAPGTPLLALALLMRIARPWIRRRTRGDRGVGGRGRFCVGHAGRWQCRLDLVDSRSAASSRSGARVRCATACSLRAPRSRLPGATRAPWQRAARLPRGEQWVSSTD